MPFVAVRLLPGDFAVVQVASNLELADNDAAIEQGARRHAGARQAPLAAVRRVHHRPASADLGVSYVTGRSTWAELADRVPWARSSWAR
ncbi:MAG: hypothetical protein U0531_16420 [Dehalococcoidia bacterium]